MFCSRALSTTCRNVIFCQQLHCFRSHNFTWGRIDLWYVKCHLSKIVSDNDVTSANFMKKLVSIREKMSFLVTDSPFFTLSERYQVLFSMRRYSIGLYSASVASTLTVLFRSPSSPLHALRYFVLCRPSFSSSFLKL